MVVQSENCVIYWRTAEIFLVSEYSFFLPVHWLRIKLLWQEPSSGRIPSYKLMDFSAAFFKVSSRIAYLISSIVLACYLSVGRDATGLLLYYFQWAHPQTKHPGKSLEYQLAQCSLTFLS